jgi:hypothetical protein
MSDTAHEAEALTLRAFLLPFYRERLVSVLTTKKRTREITSAGRLLICIPGRLAYHDGEERDDKTLLERP